MSIEHASDDVEDGRWTQRDRQRTGDVTIGERVDRSRVDEDSPFL